MPLDLDGVYERTPGMRLLAIIVVGCLGVVAVALAAPPRTSISASGATLRIPNGWHASIAKTPSCDPERLIVASSAPLRGTTTRPADGQVVVLLVEDRLKADRPVGDLRRPTHFTVRWNRLTRLEPASFCGNPDAPAFLRYFGVRSRFLGFIVYPGRDPHRDVRAATVALMDSLSVAR